MRGLVLDAEMVDELVRERKRRNRGPPLCLETRTFIIL